MYLDFRASSVCRDFPLLFVGKDEDGAIYTDYGSGDDDAWVQNTLSGRLSIGYFEPKDDDTEIPDIWDSDDNVTDVHSVVKNVGSLEFKAYSLQGFLVDFTKKHFNDAIEDSDIFFAMDSDSDTELNNFCILHETYDELMASVPDAIKNEAFIGRDVYLVCLNDFFIKSEYSDLGIEKVVLDNIYNLLQLYFNVDAAILVVNRESFNDVPIFHLIGNGFVSSPCGHSKWVYEVR